MELLVISRSQTTSFSPPPPPPATSNILRLYWGPSYDQKYIYFPFPFFPIIMLRGKGSIKPVHSNSWDRVGTVVAMAGKWQRLPAVLSRWNGAQRGEGHLKSSGITLRCVTTLGSDGDPCEVTVLEGVLLGLDWHFVEQAGICFGWPLGRKSSSHPWYSKTRAPSLFEGAEWRKPFLLQQWTGLIRFPRNAIAWMYDLNSIASHIATAKKGKADALIPNASLPQSRLYYFPCWQAIWGCCIPQSDFENTKCVPVCDSRVCVWTPRFFTRLR